ncbi:unnamed protein product [Lampetra planeri]
MFLFIGTFKIVDCIVDGMDPLCDLCPESTFSNRDHQEKTCMPCGACGPDEEVASACSLAQDTMCQCKEGFKRDPGSELCVREGPSQGAGYEEVAPLVVVVKNGTQETASNVDIGSECSSDVHGGSSELTADGEIADDMVRQVMQEYSEDLKKWVGDNTTPLLEHLINNRTITQEVYSTAKSKGGEDCVEFLLHHFLNRGGKEYFRLWNALYAVRRNYLQLWNMFNKKGEAVLAVTKAKPQLKAWIGKDPRHLLLQLINQSLIPGDVISKAKSANSDEDHAEILLDFFIRRGNDDCDKLLFALHIVKNEYPDVKQWLSSLRFLKKLLTKAPLFLDQYKDKGLYGHIRFNKEHISEAIKDDLEPLLTCLEKINYFSTTIAQIISAAAILADEECDRGFYKTHRGVCCRLCRPGTFKNIDCIADGMDSLCDLCPEGTFSNRDHQEKTCMPCGACGPDEEVAHACSLAQDTMCQCKEGFKRDPGLQLCVREGPSQGAGYEEAAPLLVVEKHGTQADGGIADETVRGVMQEYAEELKEWVGENPTPLLEHLINNCTITREVYSMAESKGGEDCVEFLLHHFLNQGGKEYFRLWNALYAIRKNYLQLWKMFNEKGEAVLAVTKAKPQLKAWIGVNPRHLLLQLINQSMIPGDVIAKAKSANSDEDHAEILLDFFIRRGNDDCDKLLFALHIVKNKYPNVKQWLSSLSEFKRL